MTATLVPHSTDQTDKEERFKRLAEQRVNAILDKLRLLGQLANRGNYKYGDAQVQTIFRAITRDVKATRDKFQEGSTNGKRFKL